MTSLNHNITVTQQNVLLLQEKYVSIYHNLTDNWLYIKWQGERTLETLMNGAELMLQCAKKTGCKKIINDSSDFTNAWPNVIDWMAEKFAPRLEEAGVEYFAWIYGDQNLTKIAADEILKREQSNILVMVFDNLQTAETWMRSV